MQSSYATAPKQYFEAEKLLGRSFSMHPSSEEIIFLVTHLLSQNLKVETVRSYLLGIKFYLMSKGVISPAKLPPLAEQLLQE